MTDELKMSDEKAEMLAVEVVDMSRRIRERATEGGKEGPSRDASYVAAAVVVGNVYQADLLWMLGYPNVNAMTESA